MMADTIAAIATPLGTAAIGVVRLSGPQALEIALKLFVPKAQSRTSQDTELSSHRAYYGTVYAPDSDSPLDQGLLLYMQAPRSYTGEDCVELQCHGGTFLLRTVLQACLSCGARLADAGEFTRRAFMHGKLDLAQAEAVADLIHGQSEPGLALAAHQLEGKLSEPVRRVRAELLSLLATIEANIDFPDEVDAPETGILQAGMAAACSEIDSLLASADAGRIWKQGLKLAIVGEPNVGKSTLLNALLRYDRAIVSPIAGTTRDTVEDDYNLQGIPIRVIDTAGLRDTDDQIESIGIARAYQALAEADLVLMIQDASQPISPVLQAQLQGLPAEKIVWVYNKLDLLTSAATSLPDTHKQGSATYSISALHGTGLEALEQGLYQQITQHLNLNQTISVNERHKLCLTRAAEALSRAQNTLEQGLPSDFLAIDLKEAVQAFGEVIGESISEEVIHEIFHQFCVGK